MDKAKCEVCGTETGRVLSLEYTDGARRDLACCDRCAPNFGKAPPPMDLIARLYARYGAMPMNPHAAARACPLCGAEDERRCACI